MAVRRNARRATRAMRSRWAAACRRDVVINQRPSGDNWPWKINSQDLLTIKRGRRKGSFMLVYFISVDQSTAGKESPHPVD